MTMLLNGKDVAEALTKKTKEDAIILKSNGIIPTLAIIRVGDNESDAAYERGASSRCEKCGVDVKSFSFNDDISSDEFYSCLEKLNNDPAVHGILMLRPLPERLDNEKARCSIDPSKDVDGCTDASLTGVFTGGDTGFPPCTPQAVIEILDHYKIDVTGKRVAVIGRSLVVGRPLAMMLMHRGATPTICHTKTKNAQQITSSSDIIVACSGQMESIGKNYIGENPAKSKIIIDVGISWNNEKGKLCGDVNFDEVYPLVGAITPVPGGVGSVTSAVLASHVVKAAKNIK